MEIGVHLCTLEFVGHFESNYLKLFHNIHIHMATKTAKIILVTGANGEVGHGLIKEINKQITVNKIIALDVNSLDSTLKENVDVFIKGSVTDRDLVAKIFQDYKIDMVFHLAAILSTTGEKNPELAHEVNVGGTFNLLSIVNQFASKNKRVIKFIFPSTIAVYGLPNLKLKTQNSKLKENEFLNPITMYGINKLYCENLGIYYSNHYGQLIYPERTCGECCRTNRRTTCYKGIDFRCLRFPGLISADTVPSGGTSDYAPEMLHAAAKGIPYECFVRPDSIIHFMAMPDAIDAMLKLANTPKEKLTQKVYNIRGFSASAGEIEKMVKKNFPKANISYKINPERQKIIDSWSEDVDGSKAVKDWGWIAKYDFEKAFEEYLIPGIKT